MKKKNTTGNPVVTKEVSGWYIPFREGFELLEGKVQVRTGFKIVDMFVDPYSRHFFEPVCQPDALFYSAQSTPR